MYFKIIEKTDLWEKCKLMILFCIPYAGGSEVGYYNWKKYLDESIHLRPVLLKGRGQRINEGFYTNFEEAVDEIYSMIKDQIDQSEYAIYGHSMGSILAFELYNKIFSEGKRLPEHIFFSGSKTPDHIKGKVKLYELSDRELIKELIDLGGTQEEVFVKKEMTDLFLPIIRNDLKILGEYEYKPNNNKIECNISILTGTNDSIKLEEALEWNNYSSREAELYTLSGNHFFINNNVEKITSIINKSLTYEKNNKVRTGVTNEYL